MKVLIVDLNNFSRYPTLSVGLFCSVLRDRGFDVEVYSPLASGVGGYPRKTRPRPWGWIDHWLRYWSHTTPSPIVRGLRHRAVDLVRPSGRRTTRRLLQEVERRIGPDVGLVLVSAYTVYHDVCRGICRFARRRGVPVVIGGPYFTEPEIAAEWLALPGISALAATEPEPFLPELVETLVRGGDAGRFPGVSVPGQPPVAPGPALTDLDRLPFPDYRDFPWHAYPNRIVPILTGRGCGWGVCTFCSDVITAAGRGFRSRSAENVLEEMRVQRRRHASTLFTFLDLKLNSDPGVWRTLAASIPSAVPGALWTASVHVGVGDDGLGRSHLLEARRAGLVRMTTGLESASRTVLGRMAKGTDPERTSEFLRHAHEAGITVRLTTILGFPGEEPDEVRETTRFLERHAAYVDRIVVNPFAIQPGTPVHRRIAREPEAFPGISGLRLNRRTATLEHVNRTVLHRSHRRAAFELIRTVHRINRKPPTRYSREFEGVM